MLDLTGKFETVGDCSVRLFMTTLSDDRDVFIGAHQTHEGHWVPGQWFGDGRGVTNSPQLTEAFVEQVVYVRPEPADPRTIVVQRKAPDNIAGFHRVTLTRGNKARLGRDLKYGVWARTYVRRKGLYQTAEGETARVAALNYSADEALGVFQRESGAWFTGEWCRDGTPRTPCTPAIFNASQPMSVVIAPDGEGLKAYCRTVAEEGCHLVTLSQTTRLKRPE